jgi:hypothetical protein
MRSPVFKGFLPRKIGEAEVAMILIAPNTTAIRHDRATDQLIGPPAPSSDPLIACVL